MATVPASGTLSMQSMAQEALYGTYGSGTITGPISLYDMTNGGNTNGSGNSYPAVNQACLPNPANRASLVLSQVEEVMVSGPTNYYYNSSIGDASNLTVGDYLYTDSGLTTVLTAGNWYQGGLTGNTTYHCNTGLDWWFDTNSSGRIIYSPACS